MEYDVFLSYSWANDDHKLRVREFADQLAQKNFKTWIDVNQMIHGDIGQIMSDGITKSRVFICCLIESYVESNNAIKELNLAIGLKKPILWVIFDNIENLTYQDILSTYGFINIHLAGSLFYKIDNFDNVVKALKSLLRPQVSHSITINNTNNEDADKLVFLPTKILKNFIEPIIESGPLFNTIDEHFNNSNEITLSGLPGIGKSTSAMQYAYQSVYTARWLFCETPSKIFESVQEIAEILSIPEWKQKNLERLIRDLAIKIRTLNKTCLMILDNVEEFSDIEPLLAGFTKNIKFILTSRNNFESNDIKTIHLSPFSKQQAIQYLQNALKSTFKENELLNILSEESENNQIIPYRIVHLAARINELRTLSLPKLKAEIKNYTKSKKDTEIIENVKSKSNSAYDLLAYSSFLNPDGIDTELMQILSGQNNTELAKNINILCNMSLFNTSTEIDTITVHRLTQKFVALSMNQTEVETIQNKIEQELDSLVPQISMTIDESWDMSKKYFLHLQTFLNKTFQKQTNQQGNLLQKLGDYIFFVTHNSKEALPYQKKALEIRKLLHNQQPNQQISDSLIKIGTNYDSIGNSEEALKYYREALDMSKQIYKNQPHPDIADSLNKIGVTYDKIGNSEEAMKYKKEALDMRKQIYKNQPHPDIAHSLNNIGVTYERIGNSEEALKYKKEALDMMKQIYKNQPHPDIAQSFNSIGVTYDKIGNSEEALKYKKEALDMRKQIYKNQPHPDIALSLNNIGVTYDNIGNSEEALKYYTEALDMRKQIYKNQPHPDIAHSLNNIGVTYERIGNSEEALKYKKEALDMMKQIYKNQPHPDIAQCLNNIGVTFYKIGNSEEAVKYFSEAQNVMFDVKNRNISKACVIS